MPKVHIRTYGCQMNERDSEQVSQMFVERGYTMTGTDEDADVVLINTCSVRDQAEQVFDIGGAQVFKDLLPLCDGMYLTWIDQTYEGDTFMPPFEADFRLKEVVGTAEHLEFRYYERSAS